MKRGYGVGCSGTFRCSWTDPAICRTRNDGQETGVQGLLQYVIVFYVQASFYSFVKRHKQCCGGVFMIEHLKHPYLKM